MACGPRTTQGRKANFFGQHRYTSTAKPGGDSVNNPKFQIGRAVAACTPCLKIVIPATKVADSRWREAGPVRHIDGVIYFRPACYCYQLDGFTSPLTGRDFWFGEYCLRPITPDEYLEAPASTTKGLTA